MSIFLNKAHMDSVIPSAAAILSTAFIPSTATSTATSTASLSTVFISSPYFTDTDDRASRLIKLDDIKIDERGNVHAALIISFIISCIICRFINFN